MREIKRVTLSRRSTFVRIAAASLMVLGARIAPHATLHAIGGDPADSPGRELCLTTSSEKVPPGGIV